MASPTSVSTLPNGDSPPKKLKKILKEKAFDNELVDAANSCIAHCKVLTSQLKMMESQLKMLEIEKGTQLKTMIDKIMVHDSKEKGFLSHLIPWSHSLIEIDIPPRRRYSHPQPMNLTNETRPIPLEMDENSPPNIPEPWEGMPPQPEVPYPIVYPVLQLEFEGDPDLSDELDEFLERFGSNKNIIPPVDQIENLDPNMNQADDVLEILVPNGEYQKLVQNKRRRGKASCKKFNKKLKSLRRLQKKIIAQI
ncbi:hypothetical protein U1Q18_042353 [Sarracenia purpurea var. burkii]